MDKSVDELLKNRKEKLEIKVEDFEIGQIYLWSPERFREKLLIMRDLLAQYGDAGGMPELDQVENPFHDEPEPILIGEGYYRLEPLSYLIDNPATVNLIGSTYEVQGRLEVNIVPVDPTGTDEPPEEIIPDEPEDLIDQRIDFLVQIKQAIDLPEDLCRDVFVEYTFFLDAEKHRTVTVSGKERTPQFEYSKQHTVESVSDMLVEYLKKECIFFKVYGFADVKTKKPTTKQFMNKFAKPQTSGPMSQQSYLEASTASSVNVSASSNDSNFIVVSEQRKPMQSQKPSGQASQQNLAAQSATRLAPSTKGMTKAQIEAARAQAKAQGKDEKDCTIF